MATCGRRDDILDLLKSLEQQTYKNFELIVVDQNDTPISDLFDEYKDKFSINYIFIHLLKDYQELAMRA